MLPFILLSALTLRALPAAVPADSALIPDTTLMAGDAPVYCWDSPRLIVIGVPDTLRFIYDGRNRATVDSVARKEALRCLVNGSFFDGARGDAVHAGWLSLYGHTATPLKTDPELTHVVRMDGPGRSIGFIPAGSFAPDENPALVEFQAGPLIIDRGHVREDLIRASLNGPGRHARTLLASCDGRKLYLISAPEPVTLGEIAARLVRLSVFRGGILDVINLDGGSSVALFVRGFPQLQVNVDDRLPVLLGFH